MGWANILLDNPLLVKHLRSQLRTAQLAPWALFVLVLSASISWAGHVIPWIDTSAAAMILLGLQTLILAFGGSNQITTSLGRARESGILDFHRVSPLPPSVVALGFFLGAPIREYLLVAITVPFAVFSSYHLDPNAPGRGLIWLAQLECVLLAGTWVVQAAAMLGCLTRKKSRGSIRGSVVTFIGLIFFGGYGSVGFYYGALWVLEEKPKLNFFGRMIPWLGWVLIYAVPSFAFLALAITRKMRAERMHAYTKPQALACMGTVAFLMVGGIWKVGRLLDPTYAAVFMATDAIVLAAVYGLALAALVLAATITPTAGEYVKGVRRARRAGRRRPSPWSDAGSNRLVLVILCALVLVGASTAVNIVGRDPISPRESWPQWSLDQTATQRALLSNDAWQALRRQMMSRPIAIAVLTVAYAGFALQFFSLRAQRLGGAALTMVFLFLAWLVPVLAGAILGMSSQPWQAIALTVLAISPLPGLALSAGFGDLAANDSIRIAAMVPPITFAFLFKYLVIITQRQIDRLLLGPKQATTLGTAEAEELDRALLRKSQDVHETGLVR